MPDLPGGDSALARIHRRFARPARYTMRNHAFLPVTAVRAHSAAGLLFDDQTPRQLAFEIRKDELPGIPDQGDTLAENDGAGPVWRVIEVTDLDDVDAWRVVVGQAA